jgi:hypothetical protein
MLIPLIDRPLDSSQNCVAHILTICQQQSESVAGASLESDSGIFLCFESGAALHCLPQKIHPTDGGGAVEGGGVRISFKASTNLDTFLRSTEFSWKFLRLKMK